MTARTPTRPLRYRPIDDFPWDTFLANLDGLIEKAGGRSDFAASTGISFWTVTTWFRRAHVPRADNLIAIRNVYGVSLDSLLFGRAA